MDNLKKELKRLFSLQDTLSECHKLHVEILALLDHADDSRRQEILSKRAEE